MNSQTASYIALTALSVVGALLVVMFASDAAQFVADGIAADLANVGKR